jgi:hypothetical protein
MPPRFCMTILRFTIGIALILANTPKVGANQPKTIQDIPLCQKEPLLRKTSLKQIGKFCKTSESSETENLDKSPAKANTDAQINDAQSNPDNSNEDEAVDNATDLEPNNLNEDSSSLETDNNSDQNIPDNFTEQTNPQSSQQDSHDINFSLDLNLGGGSTVPLDGGTETIPSEPEQSDFSSVNPSQNAPTSPTSSQGSDSQELTFPNPKLKGKKNRPSKAEQIKKKQRIKEENHNKRDRPSHRKHPERTSDEDSKPHLKPGKHKDLQKNEHHPKKNHEKARVGNTGHNDQPKRVKSRNHPSGKALRHSFDKSS